MSEANGVARLPEVEQLTGLSRSSIYRLERLEANSQIQFPKRVKLGPRAVGWPREAVLDWCANRPSASSNPAA